MTASRVLLLDTGFSAMPIFEALKNAGFEVFAIGNRPTDPIAQMAAARWIGGDYSNLALVRTVIEEHGITFVVPGCTDVSLDTFSKMNVQNKYKYDTETNSIIGQKSQFRELCARLQLPSPLVYPEDQLPDTGKLICKPVDGYSGRGVSTVEASDKAGIRKSSDFARKYSPNKTIIFEQFIEGTLYSFSAFLEQGKVVKYFTVREGGRHDRYAVDTSHVVYFSEFDKLITTLKNSSETISEYLDLADGLLHIQFIYNGNTITLIEMTRRCPGDLYAMLIRLSTGYDYAAQYASYFVQSEPPVHSLATKYILRRTIKQSGTTHFRCLDFDADTRVSTVYPLRVIGEPLDPAINNRVAVAFSELPDAASLAALYESEMSGQA